MRSIKAFSILVLVCISYHSIAQRKNPETLKIIGRIENNIIPIGSSGADSGKPQSLAARMQRFKVPGVSISVFDHGQIVWAKGYGFRDKTTSLKVDTASMFQAASISKPLASVGMFVLSQQGLINPDMDVNEQLHTWKLPETDFTKEEKVTPRKIVSHMAGLSIHGFYGYNTKEPLPTTIQILDGLPPANSKPVRVIAKPGTREIYSGGGFVLLQLLMEDVTGKSFPSLMDELVLQPAGMNRSTYAIPFPNGREREIAQGHLSDGSMVEGGYNVYPEQTAAGLWTTANDLARFMLVIGDGYRGKKSILSQSTAKTMFTRVPNGSGQGFGLDGSGDGLRFRHNGGNLGYACYAVSFANTGSGIVIMTNSDNGWNLIREIVRAISREYHWGPLLPGEKS